MSKKLFMIGMGGSVGNATLEVHDMQYVIAKSKEEAFDIVKNRWYGKSLHIDSYTEVKYLNGYEVDLEGELDKNVYVVVYGGYKKGYIDELHDYNFVLAESKIEAKTKAKSEMSSYPHMDHVDNIVDLFEYIGTRFGLKKSDKTFKDNEINHYFLKLIK